MPARLQSAPVTWQTGAMASVEVYPDRLVIRLSTAEQLLAMRRRDIVLERDAISSALITDDPGVWLRGVRSPGTRLPGRLAIGTWRTHSGRDFVLARRGRPAVVLDFDVPEESAVDTATDGSGNGNSGDGDAGNGDVSREFDTFSRVVLSTRRAAELIHALRMENSDTVFIAGAE